MSAEGLYTISPSSRHAVKGCCLCNCKRSHSGAVHRHWDVNIRAWQRQGYVPSIFQLIILTENSSYWSHIVASHWGTNVSGFMCSYRDIYRLSHMNRHQIVRQFWISRSSHPQSISTRPWLLPYRHRLHVSWRLSCRPFYITLLRSETIIQGKEMLMSVLV